MKRLQQNKGFTLVELLICMALLSIIMLMIVQFMSTSTGAQKRTKYNMKAQTSANELMTNISDMMSQANYVRVIPLEGTVYEKPAGTRLDDMNISTKRPTSDLSSFSFDLVVDDYGNYVRNTNINTTERKVIVDMDTFQLCGEKKDTTYPLTDDLEASKNIRSFRCMKKDNGGSITYLYVKPAYIYLEYNTRTYNPDDSYTDTLNYVIYRFDYTDATSGKIYMERGVADRNDSERTNTAKTAVDALSGEDGLLADKINDMYLSCDAEGGAFMLDALVDVEGYMYNTSTTVALRNSNVLTAKPINSFKLDGTGNIVPEEGEEESGEETGEENSGGTTNPDEE